MFSIEEYIIGWAVYLVAVIGLLAVFWRMTRSIPWLYFKQSLRLVVAALLLLPATIEAMPTYWAPAWVKGLLHLIFSGVEGFWPVGRSLLIGVLFTLVVYLVLLIVTHFYQQKRQAES